MRRLAKHSGLAVNTLYSLFGGARDDILEALIEEGLQQFHQSLAGAEFRDPFDLATSIITRGTEHILASEAVFRAAYLAELQSMKLRPWGFGEGARRGVEALGAAVEAGLLRDDVDLSLLAEEIFQRFRATAHHWALGSIDGPQLRARTLYSLHLCLLAAATDEGRERLRPGLRAVERELRPRGKG